MVEVICAKPGCKEPAFWPTSHYCLQHHKEKLHTARIEDKVAEGSITVVPNSAYTTIMNGNGLIIEDSKGNRRVQICADTFSQPMGHDSDGWPIGATKPRVSLSYDPGTDTYTVSASDGDRKLSYRAQTESDCKYWVKHILPKQWLHGEPKEFKMVYNPVYKYWIVTLPGGMDASFGTIDAALDYVRENAAIIIPDKSSTKLDDKPSNYGGW